MGKGNWEKTGVIFIVYLFCIQMVLPAKLFAEDKYLVGSRAMGMAGANVACTNDNSAQYYNPAAFGFFGMHGKESKVEGRFDTDNNNLASKDWRFEVHAGAGYRLHENLSELLNDLNDINTTLLSTNSVKSEADVKNLVKTTEILNRLDEKGNAITMDANAGTSIGFGHMALGAYGFLQANARVLTVDTTNLGIKGSIDLDTELLTITPAGYTGEAPSLFTLAQQAQLTAAGFNADSIKKLDYVARQAGIDAGTLQGTIDILASVESQTTGSTPGGDLENNTTSAELRAFGYTEIPLSYGHAFNENFSIGGNIKMMRGRVYGKEVVVFNKDSSDILEDATKSYKETTTFGVDLGAMYRIKRFNLGLVARNINSPEFDGPTVSGKVFPDVTIDPSLTAGIAFIPYEGFTLETDYDLTKNETVFPDYNTRNLSIGAEWLFLRFLALRAGAYKNTAESDIGWVYTAGLGLNLIGLRLDLGGAYSANQGEFDGNKFPVETRVMLQFSLDY
ncbi:MAG: conjugal transfer protein TraF [Elusimicrobia bacterium]|nr:conjugal transfer protein TraF [Elusimicrobiota bacterium]